MGGKKKEWDIQWGEVVQEKAGNSFLERARMANGSNNFRKKRSTLEQQFIWWSVQLPASDYNKTITFFFFYKATSFIQLTNRTATKLKVTEQTRQTKLAAILNSDNIKKKTLEQIMFSPKAKHSPSFLTGDNRKHWNRFGKGLRGRKPPLPQIMT